MSSNTKAGFEILEGRFHDGLGTYAEITLANQIINMYRIDQPKIDYGNCFEKMYNVINSLSREDKIRELFSCEIENINRGVTESINILTSKFSIKDPIRVSHTPNDYSDAKAADLRIMCSDGNIILLSVKTDKSGKVAIADGQTSLIYEKWANRFFQMSRLEYNQMLNRLGYHSEDHMKLHYLNVANLAANIMIDKLGIVNYKIDDFSQARPTKIDSVKYLMTQLLYYKRGSDNCHVVVIDRSTASVKWETCLDSIDINNLILSDVTFVPSRPKYGRPISSEFGIKIQGKTVVSFQVKHKRGKARDTIRKDEFLDITTRLRI